MLTSLIRAGVDSPDFIFRVLEELKNQGATDVSLYYGETSGIDDRGVEPEYRNVRITWTPPAAMLCEVQVLWQGKVKDLVTFNTDTFPTILERISGSRTILPDTPGISSHCQGGYQYRRREVGRLREGVFLL